MGTRSAIIVKVGKGYKGIYCHWDGYPSHVGRILHEHYNTQDKANALVALGDLSSLKENIAPPVGFTHTFDKPIDNVTVAYGRDRGETGIETKVGSTAKEVADRIDHAFCYVFKRGQWRVVSCWDEKSKGHSIPVAIKMEDAGTL